MALHHLLHNDRFPILPRVRNDLAQNPIVANDSVERRRARPHLRLHLPHLLRREPAHPLGHLLIRRLPIRTGAQLLRGPMDLRIGELQALRQPDGARRVPDGHRKRVSNPVRGVSGKAKAQLDVELGGGLDDGKTALLHQVLLRGALINLAAAGPLHPSDGRLDQPNVGRDDRGLCLPSLIENRLEFVYRHSGRSRPVGVADGGLVEV
mmetsp:Transcript_15229/g.49698  ORF Transcript_15229/g.49698 Transcript_15229/m.49698 type:complete len:208 (+) Transcript_15229:659-1282(+)